MKAVKPNALVVGGTSGLGFEMARLLRETHRVTITGRGPRGTFDDVEFKYLNISGNSQSSALELTRAIEILLGSFSEKIDLLVYAAGFGQERLISELTNYDITQMVNVGLVVPTIFARNLLLRSSALKFVLIGSTSQFTPRVREPLYTAVKAGAAMLAQSLSLDPNMEKVLVAAPAGMNTPFWKSGDRSEKDLTNMLNPNWVAQQIVPQISESYRYRFMKILRGPARVEIVETR